ncbi:MAG: hypothetical protein HUU18_06275 [Phycisphaerales bacterium]|nr:hypothetical protein [Phycisphaerales bacterium]
MKTARRQGIVTRVALVALGAAAWASLSGCYAGALIESYKRSSTKTVSAEYTRLEGKSFAVVVAADRAIQADHPLLTDHITSRVTERLSAGTNVPVAGGFVPAPMVLKYMYNTPGWSTASRVELAKALGGEGQTVERIIYIDLYEYRLADPGNKYEWDGVAAGTVSVYEIDSTLPEEPAFERTIQVRFPGKKGIGPEQMDRVSVTSALALRFVDRASWLFYSHEEPYYPEY